MLFPTSTELETRLAGSVARFALGSFLIYAVKSRPEATNDGGAVGITLQPRLA